METSGRWRSAYRQAEFKRLRKKTRMLIFLAGLFIIVLAPVLQLTRVGGVIAADRFTYVAILAPKNCRELCVLNILSHD